MDKGNKLKLVPIKDRVLLTIDEASAYTGIGEQNMKVLVGKDDCDFLFWVGAKRMIKRKKLEEYLLRTDRV